VANVKSRDLEYEIKDYSFRSFIDVDDKAEEVENYSFSELSSHSPEDVKGQKKIIRLEKELAENNDFKISSVVLKHRGFSKLENDEREKRISEEVEKRVIELEKNAVDKGFAEGVRLGKEEVYNQLKDSTEEKMTTFTTMLSEVLSHKEEVIEEQKKEIFSVVKDLCRWIILRELKDDGTYIHRLLEKLVLEMQTKDNLLIKVNQASFEKMPDVLEFVQGKLGHLKNVRVEVDYDLEKPGIVLESENGIINADLDVQFNCLAGLFESVGVPSKEEV